jgi:hypothetical protein
MFTAVYEVHDMLRPLPSEGEILDAIDWHSDALEQVDDDGSLPIHIECKYQCRLSIISKCAQLYPESLTIEDGNGELPLQLAMMSDQSSESTVLWLIDNYPDLVRASDASLELPIHIECSRNCRLSIFEMYPTIS